jgi:hypothetical protein
MSVYSYRKVVRGNLYGVISAGATGDGIVLEIVPRALTCQTVQATGQ